MGEFEVFPSPKHEDFFKYDIMGQFPKYDINGGGQDLGCGVQALEDTSEISYGSCWGAFVKFLEIFGSLLGAL